MIGERCASADVPGGGRARSGLGRLARAWLPVFALVLAPASATAAAEATSGRVLADFDTPGRWHALAGSPEGRIRIEAAPDPTGARPGRSLHLRFSFAEPSEERYGLTGLRVSFDPAIDASGFDHLALWIRGDEQAGFGSSLKLQLQRRDPETGGLLETGSFVVAGIDRGWQRVVVPLGRLAGLSEWKDLSDFALVIQARRVGLASGGYWIDDLELIATGEPGPRASDRLLPAGKQAWERETGSRLEQTRRLHARLAGWPERAVVDPDELPRDPDAFLWRLARDTWRGLDALTDRASGLPIDNVRFGGGSVAVDAARIGDFTNVTSAGLHLMAIAAAVDLGLIPREAAAEKSRLLLTTLAGLETHAGFFYNYYDTTTLERSSHFVSFVDSAWLTAGLLVTRNAFPELAERVTPLVERGDYAFFYDPVEELMNHGFWTQLGVPAEYHYGLLFTEARTGSLLAVGKGDVPREHWTRLRDAFEVFSSHARPRLGVRTRTLRSRTPQPRSWQGIEFAPSWGGSMFEALMPVLVLDEPRLAPQTLGRNDEAHAVIQRRYALERLGLPVWGFSPSAEPGSDSYEEYGVPLLGIAGYPAKVVAPYASALALAVTPGPAAQNLRRLADIPGAYGDYGLYDSVEPATGEVATKYLALDQSMLFLALANHITHSPSDPGGCVRRHFAADPIVQRALPLVADEPSAD